MPASDRASDRALDRASERRSLVRTGVVWEALRRALAAPGADAEQRASIVDLGGGTGGFAVPLAELGHRVLVVDPSPDALAALGRRAAEHGVTDLVTGVQGDVVTGTQGTGEPMAATTCGFVGAEHMPNDTMFLLGIKSMTVAAGFCVVLHRFSGVTVNWLGMVPKLHRSVAPEQT